MSLLQSVGIETSFIATQDDFIVLFNTEVEGSRAGTFFDGTDRLVILDDDLIWLVATVAMTLKVDYRWKQTPDMEHGPITSFIERLVNRMNHYADEGYSTRAMVEMVEDETGIALVPNKSWRD